MKETASLLATLVERKGQILPNLRNWQKRIQQLFDMLIHGECFIYKDAKISNRLREWYVVTRYRHRSKIGGDLTYLRLGTNGNELSFIIIHLQHTVTHPLSNIFNTVFQTMDKSWEVWGNTCVVKLGIVCEEMVWVAWLTNDSTERLCVQSR